MRWIMILRWLQLQLKRLRNTYKEKRKNRANILRLFRPANFFMVHVKLNENRNDIYEPGNRMVRCDDKLGKFLYQFFPMFYFVGTIQTKKLNASNKINLIDCLNVSVNSCKFACKFLTYNLYYDPYIVQNCCPFLHITLVSMIASRSISWMYIELLFSHLKTYVNQLCALDHDCYLMLLLLTK